MRYLYKYYSKLEYILDLIKNTRLYFSSPYEFNDPFDCRPKFSLLYCTNESIVDWKDFFSILAKWEHKGISDDEAQKQSDANIEKGFHKNKKWLLECEEYNSTIIKKELNKIRICCLTKTARNQMMWAHYANNHQGIALQFNSSFMFDFNTGTYKGFDVKYYPKRINLNSYVAAIKATLQGDDNAFTRFMYCSKSIEWNQELEVRFFSNNIHVPFPQEMLSGILIGSKCSPQWENEIHEAISSWAIKPKIYKENMDKSSVKAYFNLTNFA